MKREMERYELATRMVLETLRSGVAMEEHRLVERAFRLADLLLSKKPEEKEDGE